jgi:hypothetical protein
MSTEGWRTTGRRAGFSLAATIAAFLAGFLVLPLFFYISTEGPLAGTLISLTLVIGAAVAAVWFARRSRIRPAWLAWPLIGAAVAGFIGVVAWIASVLEGMD